MGMNDLKEDRDFESKDRKVLSKGSKISKNMDIDRIKDANVSDIIDWFIKEGYLLSPETIDYIKDKDLSSIVNSISQQDDVVYVDDVVLDYLNKAGQDKNSRKYDDFNWFEFEKAVVEKEINNNSMLYERFVNVIEERFKNYDSTSFLKENKSENNDKKTSDTNSDKEEIINEETKNKISRLVASDENIYDIDTSLSVVSSYDDFEVKRSVECFVNYYKYRLKFLSKLLMNRSELSNVVSISKIRGQEEVSLIGLVSDIQKRNNLIITLEDTTGTVKVVVGKNTEDLVNIYNNIVLDEVIGVNGTYRNGVVFAKSIFEPGVPNNLSVKKSPEDVNVAFISDLHVGSKLFLEKEFMKFIRWINGKYGTKANKELAFKTKYLLVAGDLVDGVGIYPGQEDELSIKDIYEQYNTVSYYLSQIRNDIKIILIPGNHDAVRLAEPQPGFDKMFAKSLYELENVTILSNPCVINIHKTKDFEGFNILLYHGYSFDYYINNVSSIRLNGGYDRADLMMKFLLKKRHLSPTHGATLFVPDPSKDGLLIDVVPDIFVTGHIHRTAVSSYNNITLISGSCWQSKTSFQEKLGHHPEPARVPVMNLKTRRINVLRFG